MAGKWGHSRQWATQQLNWLRMTELLEANGKSSYQVGLTAADAQVLVRLEDDPELFVQAIEQADAEVKHGGKRTKRMLQAAVNRMEKFKESRKDVPDLTYEESRTLTSLGTSRQSQPNLVEAAAAKAEAEHRPLADCLTEACRSQHCVPVDAHLLAVARGKELEALVKPLAGLLAEWEEVAALKEQQKELEARLAGVKEKLTPPTEQLLLESAPGSPSLKEIAAAHGLPREDDDKEDLLPSEALSGYLDNIDIDGITLTEEQAAIIQECVANLGGGENAVLVLLAWCAQSLAGSSDSN